MSPAQRLQGYCFAPPPKKKPCSPRRRQQRWSLGESVTSAASATPSDGVGAACARSRRQCPGPTSTPPGRSPPARAASSPRDGPRAGPQGQRPHVRRNCCHSSIAYCILAQLPEAVDVVTRGLRALSRHAHQALQTQAHGRQKTATRLPDCDHLLPENFLSLKTHSMGADTFYKKSSSCSCPAAECSLPP